MAVFLDVSIIKNFSAVFTFILVFVIMYGLMQSLKLLGDNKNGPHALIAVVVAFLVSMSSGVTTVLQTFTPWFTILIIIIFFILFAVRMFGVDTATITKAFANNGSILTWILIFTAVILLFAFGAGFGQTTLDEGQKGGNTTSIATGATTVPTDTGSFSQNLYNTLYHPKVLGLILIMLIVVIAMMFLTEADKL